MVKVTSKTVSINRQPEEIFQAVGNFNSFNGMMPDQVEDLKTTDDTCSFKVKGLTNFGMRITQRTPFSNIHIENDDTIPMPVKFSFDWHLVQDGNATNVTATFEVDVNFMMGGMIKKPLQNFADALVTALKTKMDV